MARLFRNKIFWLVIATLGSLAILSSTAKSRDNLMFYEKALSYVYVPVQKGFSYAAYYIHNLTLYFNDARALSMQNKALNLEIDKLKEENRKLLSLENENENLRAILDVKGRFENYDSITCRIIAKEEGNWFNIFTIDKGTNDGIYPNMTVITPKGLVGKTISATLNSSKVMAVIDSGSSVSARLSNSRDLVVIKGDLTLRDSGLIKMNFIPVGVDVIEGDIVETSGMGGIFPPGIIIGRVASIDKNKPKSMRYAVIKPDVDFKKLEQVVVLKNK